MDRVKDSIYFYEKATRSHGQGPRSFELLYLRWYTISRNIISFGTYDGECKRPPFCPILARTLPYCISVRADLSFTIYRWSDAEEAQRKVECWQRRLVISVEFLP